MPELPFTLDQLRILKAIAAQGSFKKAADLLYVTQPAVSLQIQNLEKQLEITIFDRGGRKALLTEAGRLLLEYCCLLYTSPSPRDAHESRMPSSA